MNIPVFKISLIAVIVSGIINIQTVFAAKSGSITISPSSPYGSWSCSLEPDESASLSITVQLSGSAGGVQYQLKSKSTSFSNTDPDFLWTGGGGSYSIVNTVYENATAVVTVDAVWTPVTGGGGGQGKPPPDIYGTATGTAVAQPGEYYNSASANVLKVGQNTTVSAYENDELQDSDWSIDGPAEFEGSTSGESTVTVKGTEPSSTEFDVTVESTSTDSGKSDSESLTVVGIDAISPGGITGCVNQSVTISATTQPEGYDDMISWSGGGDPASQSGGPEFETSWSDGGEYDVVASCGTSATTCSVTILELQFNSLSVEKGHNMHFYTGSTNGYTILVADTEYGPIAGAYLEGEATLLPADLEINWELQFKQYYTRTTIATLTDDSSVTNIDYGWDTKLGSDYYDSTTNATSGTHELNSEDSPSQALNITLMYYQGVRSVTFSDVFNLYFFGKVDSVSLYEELGQQDWGWSFAFSLSTNTAGEVEYEITDRQEIHEID